MSNDDFYLYQIIQRYQPKNLNNFSYEILALKSMLIKWANTCFIDIFDSGSRAKNTAIALASDVDYVISLTNDCNRNQGGLNTTYHSLFNACTSHYQYSNVRKQNVSVRISLRNGLFPFNQLEVDVTPARKHTGNTNYHSIWVSKENTWKQTNIHKHINDVSFSGRTDEIKLIKIWRELNKLEFPSIYLEYLLINQLLHYKPKGSNYLAYNFHHILHELALTQNNPLLGLKIIDPANSTNILSDLISVEEKKKIIYAAMSSRSKSHITQIIY
ncbi:hypothetical protein [Legionella sp. 31fI33]|uniref:hypothetical protein n=1 Tax=Legionella sp. 31fI33 TaxID=2886376 RepID=UPI001E479EB5|nr:hypothetical protein [Legionella sp. 31fI33]MCC5014866.1 hypothetical protein [Legionella sp. 31fI33]